MHTRYTDRAVEVLFVELYCQQIRNEGHTRCTHTRSTYTHVEWFYAPFHCCDISEVLGIGFFLFCSKVQQTSDNS